MRRLGRITARTLGVAVAGGLATVASAAGATAAQAAPPSVHLTCESGESRFLCSVTVTGGTPTSIRWSNSGVPLPGLNERRTVTGSCTANSTIQVTVVTPGGSAARSWRGCRSGPWL